MLSRKFASMELSGFEEYLARIRVAGENINDAVAKAVEASAEPIADDVEQWALEHKFSGDVLRGVINPAANIEGNDITCEVGVSGEGESWHAVFAEYGSPRNKADPGIRTAFENNKKKVRQIQRQVLKQEGAPVDDR
jgi:HK97 gp10 family phage protein